MMFSVLAWPGGTPSISPTAPLSLASLPLSRLPAGFVVFSTTNSCLTVPMFLSTNLTLPFCAPWVPGKTLNSSTWTATRGFEVTASPVETAPETATTVTTAPSGISPRRDQGFHVSPSGTCEPQALVAVDPFTCYAPDLDSRERVERNPEPVGPTRPVQNEARRRCSGLDERARVLDHEQDRDADEQWCEERAESGLIEPGAEPTPNSAPAMAAAAKSVRLRRGRPRARARASARENRSRRQRAAGADARARGCSLRRARVRAP